MKLKEKLKKFSNWLIESKRVNFEMSVITTFMFFWLALIMCTQLSGKLSANVLAAVTFGATYLVCRWRVGSVANMSYTEGICDGLKENMEKIKECQAELSKLKAIIESAKEDSEKDK